jgi:cell division GTPase FtsZ
MAPKRKLEEAKEADEFIQDVISKVKEVKVTTRIDPEDRQARVMAALEGLRPGIGVIGTREQEEQLAKGLE